MNRSGSVKWFGVVAVTVLLPLLVFYGYRNLSAGTAAGPAVIENVQYAFENGKGLVNLAVEDVYLGVGMITGEIMTDGFSRDGFTGNISFEMVHPEPGIRIQLDHIRLIEQTPKGDGRVFEPYRIYDDDGTKGKSGTLEFPKLPEFFPVAWKSGGPNGFLVFEFNELPADLAKADLVLTYQAKLPGKKYPAHYENRLTVLRKIYRENRNRTAS